MFILHLSPCEQLADVILVLWRPRMYEHLGRNPGINSWQICQPVTINMCTLFCVFSRVPYFVELTSYPPQYSTKKLPGIICNFSVRHSSLSDSKWLIDFMHGL
jgi:hypothetical protein